MHTKSLLLFANPISGMGRGRQIAENLAMSASLAGYDVHLHLQHPSLLAGNLLPRGNDGIVIVIGGDGTLRSVADRLWQEKLTASEAPSLLVIPLGTANLVASHLNYHWNLHILSRQVLDLLAQPQQKKMDVGIANGRCFLAVAGVGFDANVVHELTANRRGPITYADYLLPTARSILTYTFPALTIKVDGKTELTDTPALIFAGNIAEYGAGFSVTPAAQDDDGLLDLCMMPCRSWLELFELGCICGSGLQRHHDRVIYRRGRQVQITSSNEVPVQLDGDAEGFTPLELDLLPQQLTFIVPHHQ